MPSQPPSQASNPRESVRQKQIKINPIKLNIAGRTAGVSSSNNPDGSTKVPVRAPGKAVATKAISISNQGSGNLSQQLNQKQNPVKLLKLSQRSQAAVYNKQ